MKKNIVGMIALVILLCALPASVRADGLIRFGIKGGVNFANLVGPDLDSNWKTKTGLAAGGFVSFQINRLLAIQPEFFYSQKGSTWKDPDVTYKVNLTFVDIPLLVKFFIPVSAQSALRPNVFVGPYAGIKMSAKLTMETAEGRDETDFEDLKKTDLGLVVGGGIDFAVGKGKILLDVRYSFGFSSFSNIEDFKNKVFTVLAGYSFN
ncbi:MAG: porin family protein [Candidatus Aminicenantes bacterium]|nr:porin family protein [Candidatus Aminicenantes bacterium]